MVYVCECLEHECGWTAESSEQLESCEQCAGPVVNYTIDYWLDAKRQALTGVDGVAGGYNAPTFIARKDHIRA